MAASAPATTQLIQDRNSKDLYQLVQENLGLMLERFIEKNVIPWVLDNVTDDEVVMITGSLKDLDEMDNAVAEHLVGQAVSKHIQKFRDYPTPDEVVKAKDAQLTALKRLGSRRYVEIKKKMFEGAAAGVQVVITNEGIDRATILGKLQEVLTLAVSSQGALNLDPQGIVDTMFDMMNIPTDRIYSVQNSFPTPIDKMSTAMKKMAAAQGSQPLNKVTGAVAPQQNADQGFQPMNMMQTRQQLDTGVPGLRQTATNQSLLPQ
jgi:hypothetical protein